MHTICSKKKVTWAALLLAAVLLLPAFAGAYSPGGGRQGQGQGICAGKASRGSCGLWRNPEVVEKLGLTGEQIKGLRDADYRFREEQVELNAKVSALRLRIEKAFYEESVDENAVRRLAKEMADAKGQIYIQRVEARLAAEKLLTADQLKKLRAYQAERKDRAGKRGKRKQNRMKSGQGANL